MEREAETELHTPKFKTSILKLWDRLTVPSQTTNDTQIKAIKHLRKRDTTSRVIKAQTISTLIRLTSMNSTTLIKTIEFSMSSDRRRPNYMVYLKKRFRKETK